MSRFIIKYDDLPISANNYIRPSATYNEETGKVQIHMYETKASKDFKKRFQAYLKREVVKQKWDRSITAEGHWYLDCVFYQSRTNQDSNNYYKILCDALTGIAIEDDKNILVRTQRVMYDSKEPKFIAVLRRVDYTGIFGNQEQLRSFMESNCDLCSKKTEKCSIIRKAKEGRIQEDIKENSGVRYCDKRKA